MPEPLFAHSPLFHEPDPRLPELHERLLAHYGPPPPREPWDPLTQFIYSMLSSRTKTPESHQVMRDLRARFASWEDLRDAPVELIEQAIAIVTFAEVRLRA